MDKERRYHRRMHRRMRRRMGKMMFGGIVGALLMGAGLMFLWNALIPSLFGGPMIGLLQALGLLILAKLLFGGGCRGRRCGGYRGEHWRNRFREKMENMSPEERAEFKESFMGKGYEVNIYEVEEEEEKQEGEDGDGGDEKEEGDDQQKK